jgi:hypothetical protein
MKCVIEGFLVANFNKCQGWGGWLGQKVLLRPSSGSFAKTIANFFVPYTLLITQA